jgi:hypothetical protein
MKTLVCVQNFLFVGSKHKKRQGSQNPAFLVLE